MRKNVDFIRCGEYLVLAACSLSLYFVLDNGEPFSLALSYAMMGSGFSLPLSALLGVAPALLSDNLTLLLLYAGQALLLLCGYLLEWKVYPKSRKTTGVFPMLALSLSLGLFVAFAPFDAYLLPFFAKTPLSALTQKVLLAALLFLLATCFYVALRALTRKLLRCRLRSDETAFSILLSSLVGVGLCRFLGVNAYLGIAFCLLLLFGYVTKTSAVLLCSFFLSLPPLVCVGLSPERFFLYGAAVALAAKSGRLAAVCALLSVYFGYGYFDGLYDYPSPLLVQSLLSALLPCLLFLLLPAPFVRGLENKLQFYREKHLSRLAINRNRAAIGEKLFELSYVFREIENAFHSLTSEENERSVQEYLLKTLTDELCQNCPRKEACERGDFLSGLRRLIALGCMKGKANLIDIPRSLAELCVNQNDMLYALNRQLVEYRRYKTEAENAAAGRALLAGQAQGVSEILRALALEQSEPLQLYSDLERKFAVALLRVGVVCSEILVFGEEENLTLSLVSFGQSDVKKIAAVATHFFGQEMMISERLSLTRDKFCCILRKKPYFDAAFGVSSAKKFGESESGDTHTVARIDERKFLVALSDGMGSGEYARKVSESVVSLLESFYRAKMPSPLVLSAVNTLMTFGKEERFACVDIAVVDLDDGLADIVKIGSPLGFILSGNTVKVLENGGLPMGILEGIHPATMRYTLQENDVLVFLSDGVADAFGSTADLYEVLRRIPIRNPQQLTDTLLENALAAYGGVAKDDMTAIAVRLFKTTPTAA